MSPPDGPWEVVPGLFIGTVAHAREWPNTSVLCVLNVWPWDGNPQALWIPVVVADADNLDKPVQALPQNLDHLAFLLHSFSTQGPVLVHCRQAQERSPLAVAWYLHRFKGMTLDAAYAELRAVKPDIMDRRNWLPPSNLKHRAWVP